MKNIPLVILALVQLIIVAVLSYRRRVNINRYFMALVGVIATWTVLNAGLDYMQYTVKAPELILELINRGGFLMGCLSLFLSYRLSMVFPSKRDHGKLDRILSIVCILFFAVIFSSYVSGSFSTPQGESVAQYSYGAYVWLVAIFAAPLIFLSSRNFIRGYKVADRLVKRQTLTIFFGLISCIILGVFFVVLLPALTGKEDFIFFGYYAPLLFTGAIIYSVAKHKLFDIRAVVARSLAYSFVLVTLAGIFAGITLPLTRLVITEDFTQNQVLIIYAVVAVILAIVLQPIKKFFDRTTNRIFYRDAYDTQVVLDAVSSVIVGNVDPHKVQRGALAALSEALRPAHMVFLLGSGNGGMLRRGDAIGQQWGIQNTKELQAALKQLGKRITVYDELDEGGRLKAVLRAEDISVVAPLVTKDETIGYLVLGPKKSGNIYNSQDVGLLNIASNELAVALQNAQRFEEIQAFNITLQEKVTEATRELKKTNKKLIALDEAKDEFISMASHQLRTPLTSIKGYLSMLLEGDLGKVTTAQEKALQDAFGSSQRMVYLIADFLNVSRIKTGKFVIEPKEVNLSQLVTEEVTQLREIAATRDLTLIYEPPDAFPVVMLDDNKIRQVIMNMVDNAIYYTPAGGKITIQLYVSGEDLVFKVIDTGLGVPKREQHKLFTKFYRAGNAKKARPDGTGLGLFMAQKVIVAQGGSIIFESTEGKGSTFGFRFPLAKIKA